MSARRALTRFRAPDEGGSEDRAWEVVRAVYAERLPVEGGRSYRRPAGAFGVAVVLVGALALSPAGATVGRFITRALGVQHAAPALFSLPAQGRLLVAGPNGAWTVAPDGSSRRLGAWPDASWSPHGLYVAVARGNALAALNPRGTTQWRLARRNVRDPRWYPPTGYRVAYLSGHDLRVVAGDGTGDHLLAAGVAQVAPAWRPGHPYQVAYVTAHGRLVVRDADTGGTVWSTEAGLTPRQLTWADDGSRLLAVSASKVALYSGQGRALSTPVTPTGAPVVDAALSPDGHALALVLGEPSNSVIVVALRTRQPRMRRVLAGPGLSQVAWDPTGRWLLVSWPAANQWVFVRVAGAPRILAVSRIAQQFSSGGLSSFPRLAGWCCSTAGRAG
jgi:hypothetical protein